jgi:hypothetical protein
MGIRQQYLVRHGRLPPVILILRFVIPEYLAGRQILTFKFSISDSRVVCPRTRRWSDLLVPGGRKLEPLQWYRQLYKYWDHSYTDLGLCASWAHASKSYLPKSYRGSFQLFTLLLLSILTFPSSQAPRLGQTIHPLLILGFHREFP